METLLMNVARTPLRRAGRNLGCWRGENECVRPETPRGAPERERYRERKPPAAGKNKQTTGKISRARRGNWRKIKPGQILAPRLGLRIDFRGGSALRETERKSCGCTLFCAAHLQTKSPTMNVSSWYASLSIYGLTKVCNNLELARAVPASAIKSSIKSRRCQECPI